MWRTATGTVYFLNDTGGHGFIDTEAADEDVFFDMEDIDGPPELEEGVEVGFVIERTDKGPRATSVVREPVSGSKPSGSDASKDVDTVGDTTVFPRDDTEGPDADDDTVPSFCPCCGEGLFEHGAPDFCTVCGQKLSTLTDPNFCPECGTELRR